MSIRFSRVSFTQMLDQYLYLLIVMLLNIPLIWISLMLNLGGVDFNGTTWIYSTSVIIGY